MKFFLRLVLPLAVATGLALPGIGGDGGDNGGGTGVWILPRACYLASDVVDPASTARLARTAASCNGGITLTADSHLGALTATLVDSVSGAPVALPVNGREIVLSGGLLTELKEAGVEAQVVVTDSQHLGYVMSVAFADNGSCTIKVY